MDPSIIKLLDDDDDDDDVDETMHSGADVEAFSAALSREIKGEEPSTSQPSLHSASGGMAEENVPCQNQQEGLKNLQPQEKRSLLETDDSDQCRAGSGSHRQQSSCLMEQTRQPVRQNQSHDNQLQCQVVQTTSQVSQENAVQISEQKTARISEQQDVMRHPDQHTFPQLQKVNNQPALAAEQTNNPLHRNFQLPFALLLPIISPQLDKDSDMKLRILYDKLKTKAIKREEFARMMKSIVGEKMLRLALNKIQTQGMAKYQAALNSQTGAHQFQKSLKAPTDPSQDSSSTAQSTDSSFPTKENDPQKSRETEHQSGSQGMNVNQMSSTSMSTVKQEKELPSVPLRGLNKQQQKHLHFPQTPFSAYGSNKSNYHAHGYSKPPGSAGLASLKHQTQDSQMKQVPHHHAMGSTQAAGESQATNLVNPSTYKIQSSISEPKRFQGGNPTLQNNAAQRQLMNKEQKSRALSSLACVKQEVVDQISEQQQKSHFSASPSPCSFGATSVTSVQTKSVSVSMPTQVDTMMTVPSTSTPLRAGTVTNTPQKKTSIGQKKPCDALGTPSPVASKKQKVSGGYLDQNVEDLYDVTAVSGINLMEEEEQLFSVPKEDSRASEATRRVVQEEEERLLLQKVPLHNRLAAIMSKSGLKNISKDVERCLSLCVEERMRGIISNLIRLSKQRADIERPRHRTIITSDVRSQILFMNRKAKEDGEKKQAEEAEMLRKHSEAEGNGGTDGEKNKDEGRSKALKGNKEEDDKMRTTAANVAARNAFGGDDMLSKWQLMAEQARRKREGYNLASAAQSKDAGHRPLSTLGRTSRDNQGAENRGSSAAASGAMRKSGRASMKQHMQIVRSISVKDVIAILEKEPQMSKSTIIYRLYLLILRQDELR